MLICLLLLKWGGLSLTSLSLTVTVVVPDNPPRWPPMSLAWRTTRYSSWVSLSMSGTAVRKMPGGERRAGHAATKSQQQQISQWHHASLNYHQRESDAHILELGSCTHVTSGHLFLNRSWKMQEHANVLIHTGHMVERDTAHNIYSESSAGISYVKCKHQQKSQVMKQLLKRLSRTLEDINRPVWGSTEKKSWPWVMAYTSRALFPYVGSSASLAVTWIIDVPVEEGRHDTDDWSMDSFKLRTLKQVAA